MENKKSSFALKVIPFAMLTISPMALGSIANARPHGDKNVIVSKGHRPDSYRTKKVVVVKKNKKAPQRVFIAPPAKPRPVVQVIQRRPVQKKIIVAKTMRRPMVVVTKARPRKTTVVITKAPPRKPPVAAAKRPHRPQKIAVKRKPAHKHPRW